jgi:hypothetical protein
MQAINQNVKAQAIQAMAKKYIWWQTPIEAATWPERVIAQVMNIGDFDDAKYLLESVGGEALIETLKSAQAGWFNERSWHYWHYRLQLCKLGEVPALPVRRFNA